MFVCACVRADRLSYKPGGKSVCGIVRVRSQPDTNMSFDGWRSRTLLLLAERQYCCSGWCHDNPD